MLVKYQETIFDLRNPANDALLVKMDNMLQSFLDEQSKRFRGLNLKNKFGKLFFSTKEDFKRRDDINKR